MKPLFIKMQSDVPPRGYLPAIPPKDYTGSIADWTAAMNAIGGPSDYSELVGYWVEFDAYDSVLEECER